MAGNAVAQESICECGAVPLLVALLRDPTRPVAQAQAMAVVGALAATPAAQEEIFKAGGLPALTSLLSEPMPRTQLKESAVSALHALCRASGARANALMVQPGAQAALQGALAAYGPCWYPCKADLHCLLNLLSKAQADLHCLLNLLSKAQVIAAAEADGAVMVERPEAP
ncbi:hypothetical protein MNEG_14613 [Monoraphidium neglectum]|uniref:Uncharacterized protein n=1 Tax=Monoraphidium neglectum TaxID=145388 RepID=A0A0D2LNH1_9CHLO|nr:hypothetical protein MNEG_14613 [Monoraphidium neglectum]KIY93349.1 hypothetical protein MNEG_14613 [Monoraphidium neglectum]|eukprot:XP_013892369.1 hypothetical protein MNEG_14613 [Monoraphidium neglectum]